MASTLKGGRGQNVLQALADEQCASRFDTCLGWSTGVPDGLAVEDGNPSQETQ